LVDIILENVTEHDLDDGWPEGVRERVNEWPLDHPCLLPSSGINGEEMKKSDLPHWITVNWSSFDPFLNSKKIFKRTISTIKKVTILKKHQISSIFVNKIRNILLI
jgi:hypothetical protein